ncbi:hypothetical protein N7457_002098 [Penicillium paradoxum]|uniref:uncharacterized protein n=1 Tax=Penicillium paradoxum TaxID=176176 RepID=UPI002548979C|nr:uncharacterized protein N7457_002098 [Penicillium paradoxum]KAJ5787108.1 hypothetical protein N7457_002098 [Penicillium paradoxum]
MPLEEDQMRRQPPRCEARGKTCNYNQLPAVCEIASKPAPRQALQHVPVLASPPSSPAHSHEAPPIATVLAPITIEPCSLPDPSSVSSGLDQDPNHSRAYYAAHGRFAGQVAAAIDERAGFVPPATSYLVPLVDAPLFGDLDLPVRCSTLPTSTELPSRTYADQLVDVYWQYINPAEPILDRQQFFQYYATSYSTSGVSVHTDPHIRLSILNLVFALAVQRQESIPLDKRNEEGNTYFRRAWGLLPAESILWEPGSLERVQCLILMNRYLHCTNNQQKTWMTAGLAMRIAQTMCCHVPETPSTQDASNITRLKRKVWASCVALDRCISWSLGKTSALALITSPTNGSKQECEHTEHSRWKLELHEIGNQIQLAQIQTRSTLAARLVAPRLDQQEEYHTAAIHMDACLSKWEASLPSDFQLQNLKFLEDRTSQMERYLLHVQLLHSRIYLYRPLLARFYSMKSDPQSKSINSSSLSERLLRECARMCIDAAQSVTSLVVETLDPARGIGILPWWTRVYYLHIAGMIFLAAMVGSDLFTESVSRSWQDVLAALRAHVHLSTYVQQCVWTFEALSTKISQTNCPSYQSGAEPVMESAGCCFDDIFQDIRFDFDEFLFRTEEVVNFDGLG